MEIQPWNAGMTVSVGWRRRSCAASKTPRMRPSYISNDAWGAIFANFTAQVGSTWGSYNAALAADATYLSQLGKQEYRVSDLQAFELMKAGVNTISQRYFLGAFGYGASHPFDIWGGPWAGGWLMHYPSGTVRPFVPNPNNAGHYTGGIGDYATMALQSDQSLLLTEKSGTIYHFIPNPNVPANILLDYIQDLNGNRITANYTNGMVTSATNTAGDTWTYTWNSQGRISQMADPVGRVANFAYDTAGTHLLSIAAPVGTTSVTYVTGQGAAEENAVQSITYPDGTHTYYQYDTQGRTIQVSKDGGAQAVNFAYDSAGDITVTDALGKLSQVSLDDDGAIAHYTDPLGNLTQLSFDPEEKLIGAIGPDGSSSSLGYDSNGNPVSNRDPLGHETTTQFAAIGDLLSLTDPQGNTTQYGYDSRYNATSLTYPNDLAEQGTYDPRGNLTSWTNRRGQTITYTYNGDNLLTQKRRSNGSAVTYAYDGHRNLQSVTDAKGTISFTYDAGDRLKSVTYPNGRFLQYTYDSGGRRSSMSDSTGFAVNYNYDSVGRLSHITTGTGTLNASYAYDADGRLSQKSLGNGAYTTYGYDAAGNLLHLVNYSSGSLVNSRFDYTYDASGRRTAMTTLNGTWQYGYDANGQLTSVSLPNGSTVQYSYDAAGNRVSMVSGGATTSYNVNNLDQYTSVGGAAYGYDADGNLTSKQSGGSWTYTYDDENKLTAVSGPSGTWSYQYDAFGNRIAQVNGSTITQYLVDPTGIGSVVAQFNGSGSLVNHFAYGLDLTSLLPASGGAEFYQFDGSANTATVTGIGGTVLNTYSYLPFGEKVSTGSVPNPFTYAGQLGVSDDGDGLYYMRARYYSPQMGRFISQDPTRFRSGLNFYTYAGNDPLIGVDPSGLDTQIYGSVGGGIIAPGAGGSGSVNVGVNVDWGNLGNSTVYIQGQGNVGYGGGAYAGGGWGVNSSNGPAPTTGFSSANYAEADAGFGPVSVNGNATPDSYGGGGGFKSGPAIGFGGFSGTSYTATAVSPSFSSITNWVINQVCFVCGPGTPPWNAASGTTTNAHSSDPNGKITVGYGDQGFIPPGTTITYTIYFENQASATAPAQKVVVTDPLDANVDWSTVQLSQIGFNNVTLTVPGGLQSYSTQTNVSTDSNPVNVTASLNPSTGTLTWTMQSVDRTTGGIPANPMAGFLPPDNASRQGEGFVTFTVKPKSGLANGAAIYNQASIVFDANASISTNKVTNTIDSVYPTSAVDPLLATTTTASFTVSWSGTDPGGAGIASYDIYSSIDGGSFTLWQTATSATSATFNGALGHTYSFYSMATDNVGHRQQTPGQAQMITTVAQVVTPVITWATPAPISYGTALSATQLNATANVAGTFTYSPAAGAVLAAGSQTLSVTFTPTDTTSYTTATASVTFIVNPAKPVITWATPAAITYGTALSATQLDATANVAGTFTYSPAAGTVLAAGNQTLSVTFTPANTTNYTTVTASVVLTVNQAASSVTQQFASTQLVYPGATNITTCVTGKVTPTGSIQIDAGSTVLTTLALQGNGCAYWYISPGLNAGTYSITSVYSGDANNPSGTSAPTVLTVSPVPVNLSASCWNASFPYGGNYQCTVNVSSNAGSAQGNITYSYDGGAPVALPLSGGGAQFTLTEPPAGNQNVVISYPQQTNYAAAQPQTENFTVTSAPVQVSLTPSTWYATAGTSITFSAAVTSWSAGSPQNGTVSFYDGSTLLGTVPVNSNGQASYTTSSLPAGSQTVTAAYSGGTNYASGSTNATITLAQ